MSALLRKVVDAYAGLGIELRIALVAGIALLTTAGGILVLVRLPVDHFMDRPAPHPRWRRHPVTRIAFRVAKNLLGIVILPLGVVMSLPLVPGPGLVFLMLGLSLVDFPGKRALERRLVRNSFVRNLLNQTRARFGKPPFEIDTPEGEADRA